MNRKLHKKFTEFIKFIRIQNEDLFGGTSTSGQSRCFIAAWLRRPSDVLGRTYTFDLLCEAFWTCSGLFCSYPVSRLGLAACWERLGGCKSYEFDILVIVCNVGLDMAMWTQPVGLSCGLQGADSLPDLRWRSYTDWTCSHIFLPSSIQHSSPIQMDHYMPVSTNVFSPTSK